MSFYDLSKEQREQKYSDVQNEILLDLAQGAFSAIYKYFNDADTYIRKAGYLAVGKLYKIDVNLRMGIVKTLEQLMNEKSERVRQTVINSCGEIAMTDFFAVEHIFEIGLQDKHHCVKNAVQGSLKKSGEKNPVRIIEFAKKHITSENSEIRRQIAHGLELRGRTHPEDIMPVLRLLQFEKHRRVRPMVIHIFAQISYKMGCLEKVATELLSWRDKALVYDCLSAIIKQHYHINSHFKTVETLSPRECEKYISTLFGDSATWTK